MYKRLKSAMIMKGDDQKTLAELLDVSIPSISRRLSGDIDWSISEIETLCERYNMSFEELFEKDKA